MCTCVIRYTFYLCMCFCANCNVRLGLGVSACGSPGVSHSDCANIFVFGLTSLV